MTTQKNPFFVGGPVPATHFIGRTSVVETAFDQIANRSHLAIYGTSGVGKTSLLKYLMMPEVWHAHNLDRNEAVIVFLDCSGLHPFSSLAFYREILSQLHEYFDDDASLQDQIEVRRTKPIVDKGDLRWIIREIGSRGKFLLLFQSDYDFACQVHPQYTQDDILAFLYDFRSLINDQSVQPHISTIVTSFRRLNELAPILGGSPWYNLYMFNPLRPFHEDEVSQLLSLMPRWWAFTIEEQAAIREFAGGHPALLQNACSLIYRAISEGVPPTADLELFKRDFLASSEHYFDAAWEHASEVERLLMQLVALARLGGRLNRQREYKLGDIDKILSQKARELNDLEDLGLIRRTLSGNKQEYRLSSSIMEWWVIKKIEDNQEQPELKQQEKVLLNLSRDQVTQLNSVLLKVWAQKDAAIDFSQWAGRLLGAFTKGAADG